jgi:hypothetical protein
VMICVCLTLQPYYIALADVTDVVTTRATTTLAPTTTQASFSTIDLMSFSPFFVRAPVFMCLFPAPACGELPRNATCTRVDSLACTSIASPVGDFYVALSGETNGTFGFHLHLDSSCSTGVLGSNIGTDNAMIGECLSLSSSSEVCEYHLLHGLSVCRSLCLSTILVLNVLISTTLVCP